jgi:hypothetical protein
MRFEVKDLIIKIETPEGHRILGFDHEAALDRCERDSGCPMGSGCRIFSGPCQITACRETATTQRDLVDSDDRAVLRAVLLQALERLNDDTEEQEL